MMLALLVASPVQPPAAPIVPSSDAAQNISLPPTEAVPITLPNAVAASVTDIAVPPQANSVLKPPRNAISDSSQTIQTVTQPEVPACPSVSVAHGSTAAMNGHAVEVASVNTQIGDDSDRNLVPRSAKDGETQRLTPVVCPAGDVDPLDEAPKTQAVPQLPIVSLDERTGATTDDPTDQDPLKITELEATRTVGAAIAEENPVREKQGQPESQIAWETVEDRPLTLDQETAESANESGRESLLYARSAGRPTFAASSVEFSPFRNGRIPQGVIGEEFSPRDFEGGSATLQTMREAPPRVAPTATHSSLVSFEKPAVLTRSALASTHTSRHRHDESVTANSVALPFAVSQHVADSSVKPVSDQLATAVMRQLDAEPGSGVSTFRLRLDPPDLGTVDVHLAVVDDVVSIRLVAQDESARQIIDRQLEDLRQSLTHNGVSFSECHVDCEAGGHQPPDPREGTHPPIPRQPQSGSSAWRLRSQEQRATLPRGRLDVVA